MGGSKKRKGLGSMGVDVLLSSPATFNDPVREFPAASSTAGTGLRSISIELIDSSPFQPRMRFDHEQLSALADSIRSQGVIQPIVVRQKGERYELIAGERRWRAAQLAGLLELPAVVKIADDTAAAAMALVENIQREELNPIEEASAMARLIEQFEWTHQQVAEAVGKARATVSNSIRLLELCDEVKQLLSTRKLEMGHARALLPLSSERQAKAARHIVERGLNVRETEKYVRHLDSMHPPGEPAVIRKDPDIAHLEQSLADRIGAVVEIQHSPKSGKGVLKIKYRGLEELEGILAHIK